MTGGEDAEQIEADNEKVVEQTHHLVFRKRDEVAFGSGLEDMGEALRESKEHFGLKHVGSRQVLVDRIRVVVAGCGNLQLAAHKEKKLLEAQGFKPDVKLLAERLHVKESEVVEMGQRMDNWDVSLEAPVRGDSEDEQKSFLPAGGPGIENTVAGRQMRERMGKILAAIDDKLNDKERRILQSRLLTDEPLTLQTIADEFGISRERVRQIESNLLKKLRRQVEKDMPDIQDFLDGEDIAPAGPERFA